MRQATRPRQESSVRQIGIAAIGVAIGMSGATVYTTGTTLSDITNKLPLSLKAQLDPACNIKGNISINSGQHIYHVPGQEFYDETIIRPKFGERWFCSEAEAKAAGWRKAKS